jgi:hypothetical protein
MYIIPLLFALFLSALFASAQTGSYPGPLAPCPVPYDGMTPCITTYPTNPDVVTVTVGTLQCTLWSQSPTPGQVQVACCNTGCAGVYSGPLVYNSVQTITSGQFSGGYSIATGWVLWWLSPDPTPNAIDYSVATGVGPPFVTYQIVSGTF